MWRTILAHVYVIVMGTVVVMAGNILADRFGDDIVRAVSGFGAKASAEKVELEQSVKDWNKKVLD
ncbi:MAG: hypothetical protein WEB02_03500 [Methylophaga sp.]